jgi:HSP20 family molecular chaperone IbpA
MEEFFQMIDDEFESVFRRMIEQFMEAFGGMPEGSMTFRSWNGSMVNEPLDRHVEPMIEEPLVEKIDLGDSFLILIEWQTDSETPTMKVSGSTIVVNLGAERNEINVDVGFQIDLEKSNVSHRNGVIEISVVKSESEDTSSDDGFLRIE